MLNEVTVRVKSLRHLPQHFFQEEKERESALSRASNSPLGMLLYEYVSALGRWKMPLLPPYGVAGLSFVLTVVLTTPQSKILNDLLLSTTSGSCQTPVVDEGVALLSEYVDTSYACRKNVLSGLRPAVLLRNKLEAVRLTCSGKISISCTVL